MKTKKLLGITLFLGVLGAGGYAAWRVLLQGQYKKPIGGVLIPDHANPDLPRVTVGISTGYPISQLKDTGTVNTEYIGENWAFTPILKDW
ncbi:hypothetical protein [Deinococcus roseus]|uniref:Uncharacterized protein n=1 Tax=Deinococcus roseus TaxID=392414 RepID=A0ABQ2DKB2_9DEIO|nr:hypothetical protein [Deinococcus roseus]GGJ56614.1 hypothetical protein GCM10008938_48450 [Deinococcus roseus]